MRNLKQILNPCKNMGMRKEVIEMDEVKSAGTPKWLITLLVVMAVMLGAQSVFLFAMWRERPHESKRECPVSHLFGKDKAQRKATSPSEKAQAKESRDPFDGMDEMWRNFEKDDWDPFDEIRRMQDHMNSLFDDSFGRFSSAPGAKHGSHAFAFSPNLDLQDKGDSYVARMDVPGADKDNVSINLEDRVLTVSGQIDESSEKKDGDHVLRKERRSGSFKRSVTLPGPVVADKLDAQYDNGVLTVTIPKAKEETQSKTIRIK